VTKKKVLEAWARSLHVAVEMENEGDNYLQVSKNHGYVDHCDLVQHIHRSPFWKEDNHVQVCSTDHLVHTHVHEGYIDHSLGRKNPDDRREEIQTTWGAGGVSELSSGICQRTE
jgi:hypothetical protein